MADEATTTPPADAAQLEQADTQTPQQDDTTTDWVAEARKWEKRAKDNSAAAKANADAAKRLAALEDANKSETEKLTDRATKAEQERDALTAQLDALRREQAIYRHAGTADPAALLDSRAFLDSIADIDADDDKAIQAAIKQAVKDNPRLSRLGQSGGDASAGQRQQANPNTTAPGVHRMAAAFDAQLGTA